MRESDELERLLLGSLLPPNTLFNLREIAWSEVGEKVFVEYWKRLRARNHEALGPWTAVRIPEFIANAQAMSDELVDVDGKAPEPGERPGYVFHTLMASLALALLDAGGRLLRSRVGGFISSAGTGGWTWRR